MVTAPGETDLILPLPAAGEQVHPYTVHTHYFGFFVPEAGIGGYIYGRYQPAFPLSQGGVVIFRGMQNHQLLDAEHHDYRATMPWPQIDGARIVFENGLEFDFEIPGELIHIRYTSPDGSVSLDLQQRAVTPLIWRGFILPDEEIHHGETAGEHGGTEQFLHCTGQLRLRGETFAVDCYPVRDRSWNQIRTEDPGGLQPNPAIGWTPAYFGKDLSFNVTSFEAPDTDPFWKDAYDLPDGPSTSYCKWMVRDGELVEITEVRRRAIERHPVLGSATRQELESVDASGLCSRFEGRALAVSPMHSWPNIGFCDSVFRWEDERDRVTHGTYQEVWWDNYQRLKRSRSTSAR